MGTLLQNYYPSILGYLYSTVLAGFIITPISSAMWEFVGRKRPNTWQPITIGIVERILYTASIQIGQPTFVGIWLALKVAGQWHGWKDDDRTTYSNFLMGNGLSLLLRVLRL